MGLLKKDKSLVIPGDLIYEGKTLYSSTGTYKEEDKIYSKYFGMVEIKGKNVRVIPFKGRYIPREGDLVIGSVFKLFYTSWIVEINSPYNGLLTLSESVEEFIDLSEKHISEYYDIGDVILTRVKRVTPKMEIFLTMKDKMARKLTNGIVMEISPKKVPRVIGKGGTMISLIKEKTKCSIIVGQNGRIWIHGENEDIAMKAIKMVEEEAHRTGLTEKLSKWLDSEIKR